MGSVMSDGEGRWLEPPPWRMLSTSEGASSALTCAELAMRVHAVWRGVSHTLQAIIC